ncbi:MAG: YIP1 family protein [Candidatus Iainarchaeum archaeon]|uniref:YIP1 family protein n=1 Tax=Candidatus Iainarchaeum sp. TaxID=3101447 RepID=A0A7T9DK74_9ARCH|nr:MAG: YIP1 family protein [Candidatus Diapherotrites archaeon]
MTDIMEYFQIILKPEETMQRIVKKPDMKAADQAFLIYGGIIGLIFGVVVALFASIVSAIASVAGEGVVALIAGLGFLAIIIFPIVFAIVSLVGSKISYWIFYKVTALLGGKGTYDQNFWLGSQLIWPILFAQIIVWILGFVPLIGFLISIIWAFYTIYLFVVLLSVANKVSKLRALAAWILTVVLLIVVVIILAMVLASVIFAGVAYN